MLGALNIYIVVIYETCYAVTYCSIERNILHLNYVMQSLEYIVLHLHSVEPINKLGT